MIELFEEDYNLVKNGITVGTAVTGTGSSTEGYVDGNVYINSSTLDIWKLEGAVWAKKGNLKGIKSITTEESSEDEGLNTVTITTTDNKTTTFSVKNGSKGSRGNGITGVTSSRDGAVATYTIHFTDGNDFSFDVTDGTGSTWGELTGKPFAELGDQFKVAEDVLKLADSVALADDSDAWVKDHPYIKGDTCIDDNIVWEAQANNSNIKPSTDSGLNWKKVTLGELKNTLNSINQSNGSFNIVTQISSGYVSFGAKRLIFTMNLGKTIPTNKKLRISCAIVVRQNGNYIYGNGDTPINIAFEDFDATAKVNNGGNYATITSKELSFSGTPINNSVCTIQITNATITILD